MNNSRRSFLKAVALSPLAFQLGALAAEPAGRIESWPILLDRLKADPKFAPYCKTLIDHARRVAERPIVRRVYKYEDIGKYRTHLDGRAKFMEGQPRQEIFGLAMSDCGTANAIDGDLPLLAAAYRLTGDKALLARIIAQLEETATWMPIQRPGYSLCVPSPDPVPPDFNDGSWLATGQGVRALADMLEMLPPKSLPAPHFRQNHLSFA